MTRAGGTSPKTARGTIVSDAMASDLAKETRNASTTSTDRRSRVDKYSDGVTSVEGRVHSMESIHYEYG